MALELNTKKTAGTLARAAFRSEKDRCVLDVTA